MFERANKNSTNRVKKMGGYAMPEFLSMRFGKRGNTAVLVDHLKRTLIGLLPGEGGEKNEKKTLMSDRNIFCIWMEWRSIVIFPCGAYIYILLHGFGIKLKLSSGVRASGEYNLL